VTSGARPRVVVAGASGFVGRALLPVLAERCDVVALSRAEQPGQPGIAWRRCDLFSLRDTSEALRGAEYAVYLVHSMQPSARLTQAGFEDVDLLLADNFARAAAAAGIRRIVYLGGLATAGTPLSAHLESRLEVERALASRGVPVTAVRAGLVVGAGGSSFRILVRLVRRLPMMLCPAWTRTLSQPIALADAVAALARAVYDPPDGAAVLEIGGPDVLSYREMMHCTAALCGRATRSYPVPFFSPGLSRLWVSLVTGTPRALVAPLVESLRHPMLASRDDLGALLGRPGLGFEESVRRALAEEAATPPERRPASRRAGRPLREPSDVRSIQRLPLPAGRDAAWVAEEYLRWLPRRLWPLVRVERGAGGAVRLRARPFGRVLLHLRSERELSSAERQVFAIDGGLLVGRPRDAAPGRLEFREVAGRRFVLAAISDYRPALPWPVYAATQARLHLWLMRRFARHLARPESAGASFPIEKENAS
jgi:uncharacterized protein YbjT (DUF2867 family)